MNFADKLISAIEAKNSVVCVGLDPRFGRMPSFLVERFTEKYGKTRKAIAETFLEFNKGIIDSVKDIAVMVKPQVAFYEQYGADGMWAFEETCKYARDAGLLVLVDGKRNDIGSTADAYAKSYFRGSEPFVDDPEVGPIEGFYADALTINGYLGVDGILPFLRRCDKAETGVFILVKTSNPSSGDLQDRITADENMSIAELMAHFVESWGSDYVGEKGYHFVGGVVGATYPKEAKSLRKIMPTSFFLVPGYGAQGGGAEDVRECFNEDGLGAIVNSSRGIIFAYEEHGQSTKGEDFGVAARNATIEMNAALNKVRKS